MDHKPLTTILGPKKGIPPLAASRLQRWAWILSAYKYDMQFCPTNYHGSTDGLSHLPLSRAPTENNYSEPEVFNISQMEALPATVHQFYVGPTGFPVYTERMALTTIRRQKEWANSGGGMPSIGDSGYRFQEPEGEATSRVASRPPWSEPDEICSKKLYLARSG